MINLRKNKRIKRRAVREDRRKIPYIYIYEVADAARELNIAPSRLQQYIHEHREEITNDFTENY